MQLVFVCRSYAIRYSTRRLSLAISKLFNLIKNQRFQYADCLLNFASRKKTTTMKQTWQELIYLLLFESNAIWFFSPSNQLCIQLRLTNDWAHIKLWPIWNESLNAVFILPLYVSKFETKKWSYSNHIIFISFVSAFQYVLAYIVCSLLVESFRSTRIFNDVGVRQFIAHRIHSTWNNQPYY